LETILKKNEDLQNNLEKRTSAMENQFGEITKKLEKKVQENKDLEKSLKQTQNSLSKLEGISQEKDKLAKELNEIVNLQEHLTQSLKRTKEEVTSLKTQTKLEVDKAVEKIEKLERELVKKEGEIKNFQQSLERISTTATEDYKFLLEIPPRTPKTPPIN
jgi:chromosome segregation ATPase